MNQYIKHMKRFFVDAKNILTGNMQITNRLKFTAIIFSIAMVHFFLTIIFGGLKILPLFFFNICSVIIYVSGFCLIRRDIYLPVYYITYLEIILHSFVATICLGWQYGFAQYIIAIVPVGYYICYTLDIKQHKMLIATVSAFVAVLSFLSCKMLSFIWQPLYLIENPVWEIALYIFNSICVFVFLIVFSLVFVFEIKITNNQLKHQNAVLEQLASTDPLTGLYNRRSMDIFLSQAMESSSSFTLIMCDIDDFKKINDTYGHDFGDVVLQGIAKIVTSQIREQGYVCRWGGEEILILINNASLESVYRISENIRRNVESQIFEYNAERVHCSLTLGIAAHNKKDTVEETITQADYNLYRGKRNGKNMVIL